MAKNAAVFNAEEVLAPVKALNELALVNTEKFVELYVEGVRKYAGVALESWKAALAVKDLEGAQKYFSQQGEVAKEVAEGLVSDVKVVAQMSQDYATEVQKLVSDNVAKATKKAA